MVAVVISVIVTAGIIFYSPLRYTSLIPPHMHDVDAKSIHAQIAADPSKYIFIDVRPASDYALAHAEGASNTPIHLLYDQVTTLPHSGKTIVLICSGGRLSGVAFFFLQHFGFTNVVRVAGGLDQWIAEGQPVVIPEAGTH